MLLRIPSRIEKARMAIILKKKKRKISADKDVEKSEHSSIVVKATKWFNCCGKWIGDSSKSERITI